MSVPVQLGLFAGFAEVAGVHTVSAHVRTLADGTEVFVGEHLRFDRGRQAPRPPEPPGPRPAPPPPDQPGLFDPRPA